MFIDDFIIFKFEVSCGIMSMNYSTQELKGTFYLKIVPLIGFMKNYRHALVISSTSWVICNSPMIRNIISIGIRISILKT